MTMKRSVLVQLVALAVVGGLAGACSSSSPKAASTTTTASGATGTGTSAAGGSSVPSSSSVPSVPDSSTVPPSQPASTVPLGEPASTVPVGTVPPSSASAPPAAPSSVPAATPTGNEAGGVSSGASGPQNPCTLVTKDEAQAIFGKAIVDPIEAPQGPTCIYKTADSSTFLTLGTETASFDQLKAQITAINPVTSLGRPAYCGSYGSAMLFVPLSATSLFVVSAPCSIATAFAAKALPRLAGA